MKRQRYNNHKTLSYSMDKRMILKTNIILLILSVVVSTVLRQSNAKVVAAIKHASNVHQSQLRKGLLRQDKRHRRLGKGDNNKRKSNKDEYDDEPEQEDPSLDDVLHSTAMIGGLFVVKPINDNDNEGDDEDEHEDKDEDDTEQDENNDQNEEGEESPLMIDALEHPLDGEVAAQHRVDESEQDTIDVLDEGNIPVIVPMALNSPTDESDDEDEQDVVAADTRLYEVLSDNLDTVASLPGDSEDNNDYDDEDNDEEYNVFDEEEEDLLLPEQIQVMGKDVIPMEGLAKTLVDGKIIILDSNIEDDEAEEQEDVALYVVQELITPPAKTVDVDEDKDENIQGDGDNNSNEDSSQEGDDVDEEKDSQGDDENEGDLATSLTFALEDEMTSLEQTIDEIDPEPEEETTSEQQSPIVMARSRSPPRPGDTDGTIGIDLTTSETAEAAEGEPPSSDEEQDQTTSSSFVEEAAATENDIPINLTYDKTKFQFLDPSQIKAGQTTCGFLKAPLGYVPGEEFETFIKVYFCIRFANVPSPIPTKQPWLVVHCGGPGTLSDCAERMKGSYLSDKMLDMYHVVSFDQRGLGRSWPNFAHDECTFGIRQPPANRNDILSLIRRGSSSPAVPEKPQLEGIFIDSIDLSDDKQIDDYLDQSERRALRCWTCTTCEFHFESLKTGEKYHFLDYSGTQQVAQDLNYFRQTFGIAKLNLLGASYGTQIFMTFVSLYEDKVDKLVLDASMSPIVDWNHVATTFAQSLDGRLNYLNYSCRIKHLKFQLLKEHPTSSSKQLLDLEGTQLEQDCPVQDLAQCFQDVTQVLQSSLQQQYGSSYANVDKALTYLSIANHLMYMSSYDGGPTSKSKQYLKQLCDSAALSVSAERATSDPDYDLNFDDIVESIPTILMKYIRSLNASSSSSSSSSTKKTSTSNKDCQSCPTRLSNVMDKDHYATMMGYTGSYTTTSVAEALVLSQTLSGNVHNKEFIKRQIKEIMVNYPGLGTHEPARRYLYLMALGYGWPESHPISPPSSIHQKGLITSQLYDPNTPYRWTQEVKLHSFPSMTLLTSQWMEHGFIQHDIANIHHQNDKEVTSTNNNNSEAHETSSTSKNIQHDNDCFHHILQYFETGVIEVDDGTVCRTGYHNFFDSEMNDSDAIQLSPTVGQPLSSTSVIDKDGFQVGQPQDGDDAELLMELLEEEADVPNKQKGNTRRTLLRATKQLLF